MIVSTRCVGIVASATGSVRITLGGGVSILPLALVHRRLLATMQLRRLLRLVQVSEQLVRSVQCR